MRSLCSIFLLVSTLALAKPWNGIEPTVTTKDAVVKKFGEPSKVSNVAGHEVITYSAFTAIKGTVQAQFRIEPIIDSEAIEKSYGAECEAGETDGCYVRRAQEKKPVYFLYARLGLAIFFKEDGKTVQSFAFLPAKK